MTPLIAFIAPSRQTLQFVYKFVDASCRYNLVVCRVVICLCLTHSCKAQSFLFFSYSFLADFKREKEHVKNSNGESYLNFLLCFNIFYCRPYYISYIYIWNIIGSKYIEIYIYEIYIYLYIFLGGLEVLWNSTYRGGGLNVNRE